MKLGKAIKITRIRKGLKQKQVADQLSMSANYLSLLENDRRDPSWSTVCKISAVLDTPLPLLMVLAQETSDESETGVSVYTEIARGLLDVLAAAPDRLSQDG